MTLRLLVLTLHSGENEFEACKMSLAAQTKPPERHVVISDLPNAQAHKALYDRIMDAANEYDLFLKLDADMVLMRETALAEIRELFEREREADHLEVQVYDHFTGELIPAVHVYSNRVRWPEAGSGDRLFVDPRPSYPGRYLLNPPNLPPFVDHAPDPGPMQAFHFGYHRALKAYQPGRLVKRLGQARKQLRALGRLGAQFGETGRPELGLALLAADLVRRGALSGETGEKQSPSLIAAYEQLEHLTPDEICDTLQGRPMPDAGAPRLWPLSVARAVYGAELGRLLRRRDRVPNDRK